MTTEQDQQVASQFNFLRTAVTSLKEIEKQAPKTPLTTENVKSYQACINSLTDAYFQLKTAKRPATELAECQFLLSILYCDCPLLHSHFQKIEKTSNRSVSGLTHAANTLGWAIKVADLSLRNELIIQSIKRITLLFSYTETMLVINALPDKINFLKTIGTQIGNGLKCLTIANNVDAQSIQSFKKATKPLLDQIENSVSPKFSFFKSPLTLMGNAIGLGLAAVYKADSFETMGLIYMWGETGTSLGNATDTLVDRYQNPSRGHMFNI